MSDKRRKFIELAERRVNRAIKDLRLIGNLSNRHSYEYREGDIEQIFQALHEEVDNAKNRFAADGKGEHQLFKLEE